MEPITQNKGELPKYGVDNEPIKVRLVRIELSSGVTEVLAVSLTNHHKYSYQKIKDPYDEKWEAEEEIKKYLQRLMVKFFSSLKTNGVLLDFYSNVYVVNMVRFIASPVHEQIDKHSAVQKRKHKHQIN